MIEDDNHIEPIHFNSNLEEKSAELIVYTDPVGKGRPRVTTRGSFAHAYTPKKTKSYENLIKSEYISKYGYNNILEGPLKCEIKAYFSIPKSSTKRESFLMETNQTKHTKKPDNDNICKSILDALNEVAFHDDSQIVQLSSEKFYSDIPRIELKLKEIKYDDSYKVNVLKYQKDNKRSNKNGIRR